MLSKFSWDRHASRVVVHYLNGDILKWVRELQYLNRSPSIQRKRRKRRRTVKMQFMGLKYSLSPFNGVLFLTSMVSGHYKVDNCYTWFFPCEIYSVAQLSINSPRIQVSIQTPRRCGSLYEIAPKEREEPVQMMREIATTAKWRVFHLQLWCPRFIAGPALAWRFPLRE